MMRFTNVSGLPCRPRRCGAFTLIELLTVIGIILILAGLVLGLAGNAQNKAAFSRATSEIQALSSAATSYQVDNGTYPRIPNTNTTNKNSGGTSINTDNLYAFVASGGSGSANYDPTTASSTAAPAYSDTSLILYKLLCGSFYIEPSTGTITYWDPSNPPSYATDTTTKVPRPTAYYPFKTAQLKNSNSFTSGYVNPTTVSAFIDPFGFSYGYSTAYQADMDSINAGTAGTMTSPQHGYNPTFDLWSTAGYAGSGGKTYPSLTGSQTASTFYNTLWAKNW